MNQYFKKQIALPQDHGSWVFISSPLLIGIFAGENFTFATFNLIIVAVSAFLLRQPLTVAVKAYAGRRPKTDLPAACFWALLYGGIATLALRGLVLEGFGYILYLALPGIPVFAWHLRLVSKRAERRQPGMEIVATGVLSLAAPAAYWVGIREYDPVGWWLWALTWLQSAASIVYVYLRLGQRDLEQSQASVKSRSEWLRMGSRAFLYTSFNLAAAILLGCLDLIPRFIFIPFLAQWLETVWGILNPAIGCKPTRIGVRQLMVSILWTILFIVFWRLP